MYSMNFNARIEKIIHKIIKNNTIKKTIHSFVSKDNYQITFKKMIQLSKIIHQTKNSSIPIISRTFISNKLSSFIQKYHYSPSMKIADIGGGNGQILKEIGTTLKLSKEQLYCIEQNLPWSEPYPFSHSDSLQYIFWNNENIPTIESSSLDVVFLMVTLHHMTDNTIAKVFENLERLLKKGSLLIIKEHDCLTKEDQCVIDWEHHLYHLVESPLQTEEALIEYKKHYINNFKSKQQWDELIQGYGYTSIVELNRLFERNVDNKNSTNLYWKIYRFRT